MRCSHCRMRRAPGKGGSSSCAMFSKDWISGESKGIFCMRSSLYHHAIMREVLEHKHKEAKWCC